MSAHESQALTHGQADVDPAGLLLIVVGADLRAERDDRPLAVRLCRRIEAVLGARCADDPGASSGDGASPLAPMMCTDLWYLNCAELLARPAICMGHPSVNAASAYLGNRLPAALVIDDRLRIHADREFIEPQACLWGVDTACTAMAMDLFCERYLQDFLDAAIP